MAKVPREELRGRLGDVTSLTARAISNQEPAASLASGFLGMLPKHIGALNGQIGAKIAQQVLDLVALAFAANAPTGHVALSSRRTAALLHLKVTIEGALGDHSLRPVGAAAAAGISVRYANALLAEEGTSLERFIVSRRLQRCHQTLSDPAQAHRTVSDIAYSYGFSDRHTSLAALKLNSVFCRVSVDRKRRRCFKECLTRSQRASNLLALLEFVATILAGLARLSSMQANATHELVCKHAICKNKRGNQRLSARRHSSHCPGEELWRPVILSAPPRWGASILPRGTGGG